MLYSFTVFENRNGGLTTSNTRVSLLGSQTNLIPTQTIISTFRRHICIYMHNKNTKISIRR